jgi:hypothetical protein
VKSSWLRRPPRALRKAKLDNVALVPASLLPYKQQYQEIANGLPAGNILIVIPENSRPSSSVLERVASSLKNRGHPVTTLSALLTGGDIG